MRLVDDIRGRTNLSCPYEYLNSYVHAIRKITLLSDEFGRTKYENDTRKCLVYQWDFKVESFAAKSNEESILLMP